jgi:hypothetical protein
MAATGQSTSAPDTNEFEPCPGLGVGGYFVRAVSPASDELGAGLGVGGCAHGSMLLVMRSEYAVWAVGDAGTGDWGTMGELSFGFGGPRWPVHVLAGAGFALPLWDVGDLDLNSTWLCYAGVWLFVERGGGKDFSLSARHTWYSEQPTLGGQPVEMDGWSLAFSWYF